jgi:pyruvate kinase
MASTIRNLFKRAAMNEISFAARQLIAPLEELRSSAASMEEAFAPQLAHVAPQRQASARNLLHYLAMRQVDLRPLQLELSALGLSSLGRMEAMTMATLNAVLLALHSLGGQGLNAGAIMDAPLSFEEGPRLLDRHAQALFGEPAGKRNVRIMVTAPSEAVTDPQLIRSLLAAGMDVMRINCAHDDVGAWLTMIDYCRQAQRELGRPCKIYADLAGPKLRTGPIAPVGQLRKLQPKRSVRGEVLEMAQTWILPDSGGVAGEGSILLAPPEFVARIRVDDLIRFKDAGGRKRTLAVTGRVDGAWKAETNQTCYLEAGLPCYLERKGERIAVGRFGALPEVTLPIRLSVGDSLVLTREPLLGQAASFHKKGRIKQPAHIHCTLSAAFGAVMPGERIFFDDGKIGGIVADADGEEIHVTITQTPAEGARLRAEKGINLPDSVINVPALTPKDLEDLQVLHRQVDMIGLSFVRTAKDVEALYTELDRLDARDELGVVIKIENAQAFENLPRILLAGLRRPDVGVMVARGDLAVEVGFERLAEVQEEILWLCEAAHVPVIWATQVLEGLAKNGQPSRAEISDAVMSGRAECVMLNKGQHIVGAVQFLNGILERMDAHQGKKRSLLRKLTVAEVEVAEVEVAEMQATGMQVVGMETIGMDAAGA